MNPLDLLRDLPPAITLVVIALVGRTALAWTPAGQPGAHALASLPLTWSASHVLGIALLALQLSLLESVGVPTRPGLVFSPWVFAAALRWITLPGNMVPRHAPSRPEQGGRAHFLSAGVLTLTLAASLLIVLRGPADPGTRWLELASFPATLLLLSHGLETTRRSKAGRRLLVLGFALAPWCFLNRWSAGDALPMTHTALWAAAAAGALAWLRRADSRGRAVALLALAGLPSLSPTWLPAVAGVAIALVATTAQPLRVESAKLAAVVILLAGGPAIGRWPGPSTATAEAIQLRHVHRGAEVSWFLFWTAAVILVPWMLERRGRKRPQGVTAIDEPRRETRFLLAAGGLACLAMLLPVAPGVSFGCLATLPALLTGLRSLPAASLEPVR